MDEILYNHMMGERFVELVKAVIAMSGQVSDAQVKQIAMKYAGYELTDEEAREILWEAVK